MGECIQGLWIGPRLSLLEQLSIKSFLSHGHTYHLYLYQKVDDIPDGAVIRDANDILPRQTIIRYQTGPGKGSYAIFSNLFRYKLLYEHGGFWADLDIICLRPFEFAADYVFASENTPENHVKVANAVMKAPRGSECIKACYEEASRTDATTARWGETGPELLASIIRKFQLEDFVMSPTTFAPINHWEFRKLVDPTFQFEIPGKSYAVHFWNEMWRRRVSKKGFIKRTFRKPKYDKNALYGPDTLYGRLQRMYL